MIPKTQTTRVMAVVVSACAKKKGIDVEESCSIAEARETFDRHKPTRMEAWDDGRTFSFFFPLAFGKGFKVYKLTV
jgi:hypothetical protein